MISYVTAFFTFVLEYIANTKRLKNNQLCKPNAVHVYCVWVLLVYYCFTYLFTIV